MRKPPPPPRRATCTSACSPTPGTGRSRPRSRPAGPFYYAEDYHQQYLAKNPGRILRSRRHGCELPDRHRVRRYRRFVSDYEAAYRDLRERVTELLADRTDAELEQVAPAHARSGACATSSRTWPACATTSPTGTWPASRPTRGHRPRSTSEPTGGSRRVLDDWAEHAAAVEPQMNAFGQPIGQMVFDAWTHEQDVRGALGVRRRARLRARWRSRGSGSSRRTKPWRRANPAALLLVTEVGEVRLGGGEPVATVRTSRFEFLRAVTGRRSRAQVRGFDTDGVPVDGIIFSSDFFTPAVERHRRVATSPRWRCPARSHRSGIAVTPPSGPGRSPPTSARGWRRSPSAILVTSQTGQAGWAGLVAAAGFVPNALLGPLGGALADRVPRRRLLLAVGHRADRARRRPHDPRGLRCHAAVGR